VFSNVHVAGQRVEPAHDGALACALLEPSVVAEAASRFIASRPRGHAGRDEVVVPFGQVKCHLAIDIVGQTIRSDDVPESREPSHCPRSRSLRSPATARLVHIYPY
jgi:hypothetical protein